MTTHATTENQTQENEPHKEERSHSYEFDLSAVLEKQYASRFTPTIPHPSFQDLFIVPPANSNTK